MNNFAAIDFETANENPSSVCSVGVVVVHEGEVVVKIYRLIRPQPNFYDYFNTSIHSLTCTDTDDAPEFPEVWAEIAPLVRGLPLVAHNSSFDKHCLQAVFAHYGMAYPDYVFHCTCSASRRTFGSALPNHKLPTVAGHCGFDLQNHHNALADAEACAWIARQIC
jgi:DNA polymerase-3 subunit epsilon